MVNARQAAWRFAIEPASECPRLYPKGLGSCHEKTGATLTTIYLFQPGCGYLLPPSLTSHDMPKGTGSLFPQARNTRAFLFLEAHYVDDCQPLRRCGALGQ